ncbi:hypothetical protein DESUT3_16880 [Desulfuromonas versatilis]|uniref:Uncharacterized protein n=1 Tax=Desulfuromonas versatilis TaxID=2802975 RepID=A0ABN6DXK3_9BACT|nr:hypothetical protein [Desulfuromonas versatilis]BCR04619.1 hypothetical protein DESUT3_16880 [Desulfuromonas versatilis]
MFVAEPMTLFTDYLLGLVVVVLAVKLGRKGRRLRQRSVQLWALAFWASAVAAIAGGSYHGFSPWLPATGGAALWKTTVYAAGVAGFCLLAGALKGLTVPPLRHWAMGAALVKLLVYLAWMTTHNEFRYVIYDYAPSLVLVLLLQLPGLLRQERRARWIAAGILACFVGAGIQMSGFALHRHFNHNDLYHLVQIGAFYLLYRGGKLLRDR